MNQFKKYVVFTDYGIEGWKITGQADDFNEAFNLREESLGMGNQQVVIFSSVHWYVKEKTAAV